MSNQENTNELNVIMGDDFSFVMHGISENDQIIVLVDDDIYGPCSYAIKEQDGDGVVGISVDIITTNNVQIPVERQTVLIEAIMLEIVSDVSVSVEDVSDIIK